MVAVESSRAKTALSRRLRWQYRGVGSVTSFHGKGSSPESVLENEDSSAPCGPERLRGRMARLIVSP